MQVTIHHPTYGQITYEESFWTGKKTVFINDIPLEKQDKKIYIFSFNGESTFCMLNGDYYFKGVKLQIGTEIIQLVPPAKGYEIILSALISFLVIMWGNSTALCAIIPIAGGAIGGAIGGACLIINLMLIKTKEKLWQKLLISAGILLAGFLGAHLILYPLAFLLYS